MQVSITEFVELPQLGGRVAVTLSVPASLAEPADRYLAEAVAAQSFALMCSKFAHVIAGGILLLATNPEQGAQALTIVEQKLIEAGQEALDLMRENKKPQKTIAEIPAGWLSRQFYQLNNWWNRVKPFGV